MKATNNSHALQGIHTLRGLVFLKPGEARDNLDLSEGQARRAGRLKFLDLKGEPSKEVTEAPAVGVVLDMPPNEVDQLRGEIEDKDAEINRLTALLASRDIEIAKGKEEKADEPAKTAPEVIAMAGDPNVPFMSFKSAAAKLLGDKTPSKKDEIIAALEELAMQP